MKGSESRFKQDYNSSIRTAAQKFKAMLVHSQTKGMGRGLSLSQSVRLLTVPIHGALRCCLPDPFLLSFSVVCPHLGTAAVSPRGASSLGNRWENWNHEIGSAYSVDVLGLLSEGQAHTAGRKGLRNSDPAAENVVASVARLRIE